jgi:Rha family phage regulatory protein
MKTKSRHLTVSENVELIMLNADKRPVTTSLVVAEKFEKEHFHVIRDIENLGCSDEFGQSNFGLTSYIDSWNREQKMYEMTRDGFFILTMGFSGKKAMQWKEQFIAQFNRMEEFIKNRYIRYNIVTPNKILEKISRIDRKLNTLIDTGDRFSPVSLFVRHRCSLGSGYKIIKEELYDVYMDFCDYHGYSKECKAHFCMKLYACAPGTKPSSKTINYKSVPAIKGIMVEEASL